MAQATLSAGSAIQAKTGQIVTEAGGGQVAAVALDFGTQAGSTVTIELSSMGVGFTDAGFDTRVPAGFEMDAAATMFLGTTKGLWVFRKRGVAAGEGVAGSTTWNFAGPPATGLLWSWRVTEWGPDLEPVSPLSGVGRNEATGASVTTLSTGATNSTDRGNLALLAFHYWQNSAGSTPTFSFDSYTSGTFTRRDELRINLTSGPVIVQQCSAWGWGFAEAAGSYECVANVSNSAPHANDTYAGLLVAYAAATYA